MAGVTVPWRDMPAHAVDAMSLQQLRETPYPFSEQVPGPDGSAARDLMAIARLLEREYGQERLEEGRTGRRDRRTLPRMQAFMDHLRAAAASDILEAPRDLREWLMRIAVFSEGRTGMIGYSQAEADAYVARTAKRAPEAVKRPSAAAARPAGPPAAAAQPAKPPAAGRGYVIDLTND